MKRQLLVALEPQLHRIHGQHAIDGEVPADVAQHLDVVELGQPFGVVGHDGVVPAATESEKLGEGHLDAGLVGLDLLDGQDLARLVPARGIAHARGAAAHQHDRLVAAGRLHPVQHHDGVEVADVQRRRRAVVADIGDHVALDGKRVQPREVGALVDEAALIQDIEEIGLVFCHVDAGVLGVSSRCLSIRDPSLRSLRQS